MKYFKQFNTEEYEKLSNHDKFLQLDNSDVQSESSESNDVEKETNPMHENESYQILITCIRIHPLIGIFSVTKPKIGFPVRERNNVATAGPFSPFDPL